MSTQELLTAVTGAAVALGILRNEFGTRSLERNLTTEIRAVKEVMAAKLEAQTQALLRVEGVADARIKKLEEQAH